MRRAHPGEASRVADIFISYTASERDWAFWIAQELEALGHAAHVHEWEIRGGDDIYAWIEQRHDAADHVLCVVSDEYLKAPYSTLERNAAIWQAAARRPGFVLFVAVKPCRLPSLIDHYRRCELYGVADEEARRRFRAFMAHPATSAPIAYPGEAFAVSNIPIRVPTHFLGREDSLAAIEAALARYEGRVAITALHGLRGVGKTTLAAAFAERHRGDFRATWWIRAQTESTMRADLGGLGVRLKWLAPDEKEEPAFAAVMERLRLEGNGILLIYDNAIDAEALRAYLPRGGAARVLVTSNAHTWRGVAEPLEIRLWPKQIGADYLIARTGRSAERAAAEALSEALGGLPLAHEQAAAYCERLDMSLAEYQARFDATPVRFLDDTRHAPAEYHDGLTVAKTFALAIEKAAKLHPAAEPLITHAALLAPEPIPLFLFLEGRKEFGEPLAAALKDDGLIEAIAALRAFALVDRETIVDERDPALTTDCIRLHRLVRQVAQDRCEGEAREAMRRQLIDAMAAVCPLDVGDHPQTWPRVRRLDALTQSLLGDAAVPPGVEEYAANVLSAVADYRKEALAAYRQARMLHERALAIREKAVGMEHPDTARSLNSVALLLKAEGDLASARPLYERAVAICEKAVGPEHADTAVSLGNLARLLHEMGDLTTARMISERALAICKKALGPEHPSTAQSMTYLALLLRDQGDLAAAQPLFERALAICEKALGPEHQDTAVKVNNLALLAHDRGEFARARSLLERALAIRQRVFGPEHPHTAVSVNNLARVVQIEGDLAAARPLFERALAIKEKVLGPEHPDTAISLNNLALLLQAQGNLAASWPLFERALAIREKASGPEHPETATSLSNLALLLCDLGQNDDAEPLFLRAIAVGEKAFGVEHPMTERYRSAYARLLLNQHRPADALRLGQSALATHERVNGPSHPWTKNSARVTADALAALGRAEETKALRGKYGIEGEAK
jgi:tetratricopeptide (TPR) repeat protein